MSSQLGIFEDRPIDSKVTAVHAALHHNGKVLIFHCRSYPMWTRFYDPVSNKISGPNMVVPIWPLATESRPIEPSRIFCAGHCFMSDGKLLVAGGEKDFPYWTAVGGQRLHPSEGSNHLILPIRLGANNNARIIVIGGAWGTVLDTVEMIDLTDSNPIWGALDPMSVPRVDHNSIILPDRKILVIGGQNDNGPVLVPELFDTDTLTWTEPSELPYPPMEVPRKYHSSALLMQNAKVLPGGGRVTDGGDVENDTERRLTIFTPGYLLDGDQPVISVAPSEVEYQETFTVEMDGEYLLDSMAFIKPMSVTHGYNSEQRYIELAFEQIIGPGPANVYSVTAPDNSNIAPPGYYMLFVMKDVSESISGESKIPSNAVFIKLS